MTEERDLIKLARRAIERFVCEGIILSPPKVLSDEMKPRAGTFVSLHCSGELRGCIGTIEPSCANIAAEVIANAISAATRDPRFPPLCPDELADLDISVDVLTEPEPISSLEELDPKRYGVIVRSGTRRGLLLPDLQGIETAQQQVEIALRKAWIAPDEPYRMYRFEVIRHC